MMHAAEDARRLIPGEIARLALKERLTSPERGTSPNILPQRSNALNGTTSTELYSVTTGAEPRTLFLAAREEKSRAYLYRTTEGHALRQRNDDDEGQLMNSVHFLFIFFPEHNAQSVCSREDAHSIHEADGSGRERESEVPPAGEIEVIVTPTPWRARRAQSRRQEKSPGSRSRVVRRGRVRETTPTTIR
ncbi:hypothetical protein DBV15_06517 [Temnothorax longispinosus]|uniref:Uncharacterized protein n=1 Tax=Temnothorax longispinosus TaxID=300112 RepID=A0A4S2KAA8_9HYME|nr:hypothetical protein DBV15_06517 [Temnothorax longispinosus]